MKVAAVAAIALVVALSLMASIDPEGPLFEAVRRLPGRDVTGHFLIMGGLAFFVAMGFADGRLGGRVLGVVGCTALVAVAVTLEETLQIWLPHRVFDWSDLTASWAGIAVGGGLALLVRIGNGDVSRERRP